MRLEQSDKTIRGFFIGIIPKRAVVYRRFSRIQNRNFPTVLARGLTQLPSYFSRFSDKLGRYSRRKIRRHSVGHVSGSFLPRHVELAGIDILRAGRFGNNLVQIAQVISLARTLGLTYIRLPKISFLDISEPTQVDDLTFLPHDWPITEYGSFLVGDFFKGRELLLGHGVKEGRRKVLQKYIRPLLSLPEPVLAQPYELTIHLRSGDIFGPSPHPHYVQPPLAFYKKIVRSGFEAGTYSSVRLVFEDRGNPCVDALGAFVHKLGLDLIEQSGSFSEDMAVLMGARDLVFGFGTFGLSIAYLSDHLEKIDVFGPNRAYGHLMGELSVHHWHAKTGSYIHGGEWKNSSEQRNLMLNLSEDNLTMS